MNTKLANPKGFGYAAIFITGWMYSIFNAQWLHLPMPEMNLMTGLILGGVAVTAAGIISCFRGETYEFTLFSALGALFFIKALSSILSTSGGGAGYHFTAYGGWINIVWTAFFFYLWISVLRKSTLTMKDISVNLFLIGLWVTLLASAISNWISSEMGSIICLFISGYSGLGTALLAGWLSVRALWKNTAAPETETSSSM